MTERQAEVYWMIAGYLKANGFPPTRQEIADHFGFRSANAAQDHLLALERRGVLLLNAHISRGIRIIRRLRKKRY